MLLHTRPYEKDPGASDRIFAKYIKKTIDLLDSGIFSFKSLKDKLSALFTGGHLKPLSTLLRDARKEFSEQRRNDNKKPVVGLVGEFFGEVP